MQLGALPLLLLDELDPPLLLLDELLLEPPPLLLPDLFDPDDEPDGAVSLVSC